MSYYITYPSESLPVPSRAAACVKEVDVAVTIPGSSGYLRWFHPGCGSDRRSVRRRARAKAKVVVAVAKGCSLEAFSQRVSAQVFLEDRSARSPAFPWALFRRRDPPVATFRLATAAHPREQLHRGKPLRMMILAIGHRHLRKQRKICYNKYSYMRSDREIRNVIIDRILLLF